MNEPGGFRPPVVTYSEPIELRLTTRVRYFLALAFLRRFGAAFLVAFFLDVAFLAALRFVAMIGSFYWLMYCVGVTGLDSAQP